MNSDHLWIRARKTDIRTGPDIAGNFNIGFDEGIPEETKAELKKFVLWVEENFRLPVTLWVDFEFKHYLLDRSKKRVGYLFYWADFNTYPRFDNVEDIPIIRLPVRTEYSTMEDILTSFMEAISHYFLWITNEISEDCILDERETEEVLQAYLRTCLD